MGFLSPRPLVSQGSGWVVRFEMTRLGSRDGSGGSPRRRARRQAHVAIHPRGYLGHSSPGFDIGAGAGSQPGERRSSPEETLRGPSAEGRGDRGRPGLRGPERRAQGRRRRPRHGPGEYRGGSSAVLVSHPARRRDEQGGRGACKQAPRQSPVLDGHRADDDPDRGHPEGPAGRRDRSAPGLRHEDAWPADS